MDDNTCDAGSSARALVWWWSADTRSEWKFCAHHNAELEPWMLRTGHRINPRRTRHPRTRARHRAGVSDNVCPVCGRVTPVDRMPHRGCIGWGEDG